MWDKIEKQRQKNSFKDDSITLKWQDSEVLCESGREAYNHTEIANFLPNKSDQNCSGDYVAAAQNTSKQDIKRSTHV